MHFVLDEPVLLDRYRRQLGYPDPEQAVLALAAALASSPTMPSGAKVLVRLGESPVVAVACDQRDGPRVLRHCRAARSGCQSLDYVDWRRASELTAELARRLTDELGEGVRDLPFVAVPTGGGVVLDLLTRRLGLAASGCDVRSSRQVPLVVVDDIGLTGARIGEYLRAEPRRPVVVAHLFSHPELRRVVSERHPDVRCVAAADLTDRAPDVLGGTLARWRHSTLAALSPQRYWVGITEHVCFPWNEPDRGVLDHETGTVEPAWSLVPSPQSGHHPAAATEIVSDGTGPLRPAPGVVFVDIENGVLVAASRGSVFVLRGAAAPTWKALVAVGDRDAILDHLLEHYEVDGATAASDLDALLGRLVGAGLVRVHPAGRGPDRVPRQLGAGRRSGV